MPEKGAREHVDHTVNLNRANEAELAAVSDFGVERALRIIEYRSSHGEFHNVDELEKVEGFGKTLSNDLKNALQV